MKLKLFLLTAVLFTCVTGFCNGNLPETESKYNNLNNPLENIFDFTCTVTRSASYTMSGVDCNNLPWSVTTTESCSETSSNCDWADASAYACAYGMARNSAWFFSILMHDCP